MDKFTNLVILLTIAGGLAFLLTGFFEPDPFYDHVAVQEAE